MTLLTSNEIKRKLEIKTQRKTKHSERKYAQTCQQLTVGQLMWVNERLKTLKSAKLTDGYLFAYIQ